MITLPLPGPSLSRVITAGEAIGLGARELLHAGPPLADPQKPPPVLMSSAVMTALHEGWAGTQADAEKLVRDGAIRWRCAQDHRCLAPLAATIAQTTPLFEVIDPEYVLSSRYSVVSPVRGADTRMGNRDPGLAERLVVRDRDVAPAWQHWLTKNGPLPLLPIARAGLAGGDDLHYRTTSASLALADVLTPSGANDWSIAIGATPTYFLTLWMAACALLLDALAGQSAETAVVRAGGNGERFGLSLARNASHWTSMPATPPCGKRLPGVESVPACPAIGDSAVIDMAGFGGQGLQWAAEARDTFFSSGVLPADFADIPARIALGESGTFAQGRAFGVDAQKVVDTDASPLVALAILDQAGERGLLGRGVFRPEPDLFAKALRQ